MQCWQVGVAGSPTYRHRKAPLSGWWHRNLPPDVPAGGSLRRFVGCGGDGGGRWKPGSGGGRAELPPGIGCGGGAKGGDVGGQRPRTGNWADAGVGHTRRWRDADTSDTHRAWGAGARG